MSAWFLLASVLLAQAALVLGYGLAGLWIWTPLLLLAAVPWPVGLWRRQAWPASLGFALHAAGAAAGLYLGVDAGWMLAALVMALAAWDLDGFLRRLGRVERVDGRQHLETRHLLYLSAVVLLGLLLSAVALGIRLDLGFGTVLLLGLALVLGLSRVVTFFRRQGT